MDYLILIDEDNDTQKLFADSAYRSGEILLLHWQAQIEANINECAYEINH